MNAVRQLKQQAGKNILMDIALGEGKRLFPEGKRVNMTLVEATALPTGVVFMRHRRAV